MEFKRVMSLKSSGDDIKFVQTKLKEFGFFNNTIDGYFGQNMLISVADFQKSVGIRPDGIISLQTWSQIVNYSPNSEKTEDQKVQQETASYVGEDGLKIYDNLIDIEQFYTEETNKNTIFLNSTLGSSRPDWTIGNWPKKRVESSSGITTPKVASHFVIGGKSKTETLFDGKVLRAFDDKYFADYLDVSELNQNSIIIEICNWGPLNLKSDGKFYNLANFQIDESEVVQLSEPFREYLYWHRYTDLQLENLQKLLRYLIRKWNISIERKNYNSTWFDFDRKWISVGGLRTLTQINTESLSIFPQYELIEVLNSL